MVPSWTMACCGGQAVDQDVGGGGFRSRVGGGDEEGEEDDCV